MNILSFMTYLHGGLWNELNRHDLLQHMSLRCKLKTVLTDGLDDDDDDDDDDSLCRLIDSNSFGAKSYQLHMSLQPLSTGIMFILLWNLLNVEVMWKVNPAQKHMSARQNLRPLGTVTPGHWYLILSWNSQER